MYLLSVYFDEQTEKTIRNYMTQIAKHTGNTAMLDGNVPPHITMAAFHAENESAAMDIFEKVIKEVSAGEVHLVSVGAFFPRVIYLSPILNEYLHRLSLIISKEICDAHICAQAFYQPFSWVPHVTLGKTLQKEQMKTAFEVMQNQFGPIQGKIAKIGLSRTNPYTEIAVCSLVRGTEASKKYEN